MKLSIVIPCYNESRNISLILGKFASVIHREDVEVLIVDNGSTDNSQAVLEELIPKYSFSRVVKIAINQGYGYGIISGLKQTRGDFIGYTHADMQTDPADTLKALNIIEKQDNPEKCFVKGRRKGRSCFDQVFTVGMSLFETLYLKTKLWDINAQPNIFHKDFFGSIKAGCPKDFSFDLYMLYMAKKYNLNVIRFDVVFPPRIYGTSTWNRGFKSKVKFIKRTLTFSKKLKGELKWNLSRTE